MRSKRTGINSRDIREVFKAISEGLFEISLPDGSILYLKLRTASLADERNIGIVMPLHDINLATRFCDEIIALKSGHVIARVKPPELMTPAALEQVYGIPMIVSSPSGTSTTLAFATAP